MKGRFRTKYGCFSDDGTEYVISRPDTPKPWVNVICPSDYGLVVSQAGSGYSWATHATFNRLTRWEQDLVRDAWGKYLYCRDRESGAFWSLAFQPVQARGRYECRHGIGYTTLIARQRGIASRLTLFVPPDQPLELWRVTLQNLTRRPRTLELFSYFEWNLGPAPDTHREFHRLFIETEYVPAAGALLATKRLDTVVERGRGQAWNVEWPHVAFHSASVAPLAHESDKQIFLGRNGSLAAPAALGARRLSNRTGKWQDAIASLQVPVTIPPGESREITFALGLAPTRREALALARRHRAPAAVERAWKRTAKHWEATLAPLQVSTPDPSFDLLANRWLKYQTISARLRGRTGYFQPGGAFGFRDQLQDSQLFLPLDPAETRKQILLHAAHQFVDGTVYHWWHPITEEGAVKKLNDDLLWLPFVTLSYLRETADFAILDEQAPFLAPDGSRSGESGSLYEHCRRAIDSFWTRLSPRGVPRMGAGDWNDGLSAIGNRLRSESVWLAHFLVGLLDDWAAMELRRATPDHRAVRHYVRAAQTMRVAINRHFWDGDWYVRATKDSGEAIGSRHCREGKIFLNAQTWAILSRVVPPARLPRLMRSLERHLYREYGALLLAPAYRKPDPEIGYLTRYAPGSRENGGTYTHAALWAIQAECVLGRGDRAWRLFRSINPIERGGDPDLYQVEPYVTPGNVDGPDSPDFGRGGWTWYTGSAAWMFRVATEWILGVRPEYDGLRIEPCLPPEWTGFSMTRRFRGATYLIRVEVGAERSVRVDGRAWRRELVPVFDDGGVHTVDVRIPKAAARAAAKPPERAASPRRPALAARSGS